MRKIPLGTTGAEVSALCLGAMRFGTTTDEKTSWAILDAYMAAGGSFLDTANVYAAWGGGQGGESEAVLGRWLHARGNREQVFLATKAGSRLQPGGGSLRADVLVRECDASLQRMGVDTIDLFYAHCDHMSMPIDEIMEGFAQLVTAGKVRFLGTSNFYSWRMEAARQACVNAGLPMFCCVQQRYSYLQPVLGSEFGIQKVLDEGMVSFAQANGLTMLAYSPLLGGYYERPDRDPGQKYAAAVNEERMDTLRQLAKEKGVTPNQIVLAWMLQHESPVLPLLGVSSLAQLTDNLAALDCTLTTSEMQRMNLENKK